MLGATLDGKELRQKAGKILIRYRFFRFRRKTNQKQKNLKKESKIISGTVKSLKKLLFIAEKMRLWKTESNTET